MTQRTDSGNRDPRRRGDRSRDWGRPPRPGGSPARGRPTAKTPSADRRRPGSLRLVNLGGQDFELVHPPRIREVELDYEEGLEIWKAGDPEAARDALRYALAACHENLWIHVALGRIALEEFRDPTLARGHFGYAFELAKEAIPPDFSGRLPRNRPKNRPFYEAIEGLMHCYEALGSPTEIPPLKALRDRLSTAAT